jgi:sialate O-acetylesterase
MRWRRMFTGAWEAALCLLMATAAQADVRLANVFGPHMVLQRGQPIRLWGWAQPGERVQASFHGQRVSTRADAQGVWMLTLAPERAGGPHELVLRGHNELRVSDVLVGEVWVASGQSNMEWSLAQSQGGAQDAAQAHHPWLRQLTVPKRTALQPQADIEPSPWRVATPQTAGGFSAVAWHFAQRLHRELGVPVGIVHASWGGSHLETWSRPQALGQHPDFTDIVRGLPTSPQQHLARRAARDAEQVQRWQGAAPEGEAAARAWMQPAYDDAHWPQLRVPQVWEAQGLPGFDGVVWYRYTLELTPQQAQAVRAAAPGATLHLGAIDDCDETWLNGVALGRTCQWDAPRAYAVPPGLLVAGRNVIAVRVTDTGGGGGFHGEAAGVRLQWGGAALPLAGDWRARVESPATPTALGHNDLPGLLYHGMLHPLLGLGLRGVIWYQGESNAGRAAQYARTFPLLISDWRQQWRRGDFAFHFVQLAAFGPSGQDGLAGSEWAELREAQQGALALPRTGMAVAIDIGDTHDIHPRNKRDVGERLALLALASEYGLTRTAYGPRYRSLRVVGNAVELSFAPADGALALRTGQTELLGFTVADASQRFRPARAEIRGDKVIVWHADVGAPLAVRYAWRDDPGQANLVGATGLPAPPFRTDTWPLRTRDAKYTAD